MKKINLIFLSLLMSGCVRGPLTQAGQSRHAGAFLADRAVIDSDLETDGERFYFGTSSGAVFCITDSGKVDWKKKLSASIDTSILIDKNQVFVGTGDAKVYALDRATGKVLWSTELSAPPRGEMTQNNGTLFVGTNDGVIVALVKTRGDVLWKYHEEPYEKMKIQFFARGGVDQNRLFVGFPNGQLAALDVTTGAEVWKKFIQDPMARFYDLSSITLIPKKGILATLVSGPATFFSMDGNALWNYTDYASQAAPAIVDGKVLMATKDKVLWLDMDGKELKQIPYPQSIKPVGIAYDKGMIYVSTYDGSLHVFDEAKSKWLWEYEMGVSIQGAPIILKDKIWILNRRGQLISMKRR